MMTESKIYSLYLPPYVLKAIRILENEGHETWCVGGYVRDSLRGVPVHDVDLASSAHWTQMRDIFGAHGINTFETGVKHGTLSVSIDSEIIEITTYRTEGKYSDGRRPDSVSFVESIEEDLARRDFTINAIAYHPKRGLFDPFGGLNDLRQSCLRTVGKAADRFSEDSLRILRGARFASQLGFSIEPQTYKAMLSLRHLLGCISKERISEEFTKLLCGEHIRSTLLETSDVLAAVIPEIKTMQGFDQKTPYHCFDVLEHTAACLENCPVDPLIRWAAFFHDIGKPHTFSLDDSGQGHFYGHSACSIEIAKEHMGRLKMPAKCIDRILKLIKYHDTPIENSPRALKRMLRKLDEDPQLFKSLCALKKADVLGQAPQLHYRLEMIDSLLETLDTLLEEDAAFSRAHLAISGKDILSLGLEPGPYIGSLLDASLNAVIDEEIANEKEELISFIRKRIADADKE